MELRARGVAQNGLELSLGVAFSSERRCVLPGARSAAIHARAAQTRHREVEQRLERWIDAVVSAQRRRAEAPEIERERRVPVHGRPRGRGRERTTRAGQETDRHEAIERLFEKIQRRGRGQET